MHDVWFAQGYTRRDLDTFLGALSLYGQAEPPLVAVAPGDDDAAEIVIASRALFDLFGVTDERALAQRLLAGSDPGARRLATLTRTLQLPGAPRLERLRFALGPAREIITILCRRILTESGKPVFVAAALGLRADELPRGSVPATAEHRPFDGGATVRGTAIGSIPAVAALASPIAPVSVQAIQATLRTRWPASRTMRFLWQTDAEGVCTMVTPQLADVVGVSNGDLVGHRLADIASLVDPSGRLAQALEARATWSGLDVKWPMSDAPAAVDVGLGAIPAQTREHGFDGFRGYGVIHLDRIVAHASVRLPAAEPASAQDSGNVVPFPISGKTLSVEDQATFDTLRTELRDQAGLNEAELPPLVEELTPELVVEAAVPVEPAPEIQPREANVARNALALLDRLAVGLLVSRDNVPIFANRHFLDLVGFTDEDALHEAGGLMHLFGGMPGNASGSEAIGLRNHAGTIMPVNARMQRIDWDGLPATLLSLHPHADLPLAAPQVLGPPVADDARELRAILETATDGVAVMDADCNVVSLNRSGEALFGCDRSAVIGKPFLSLFAAETQSLAADYLDGLKSNATRSLLNDGREIRIKAHQGGAIPVFMTLGRLDAAGSGPAGSMPRNARFCALFRDLTQRKKAEGELDAARREAEHASALKSDFLARVSHEIRTPLSAIIGFAEVIMDERFGPVGNARYKDYLRDIHGSGTHVMSLVNDLLDLSKIEAGKMELAEDAIDVNKAVNECVSMMQPQASRERVILRLSLAQSPPRIKADARSLRQIMLNLLSNAVKYNEPGGQVIVSTASGESGHVAIRIRDTGPGMSDEEIAAALEPFRQLAPSQPGREGTGLGLPLTKALAEANEATFAIKSKPNQGTLVEIAFPPARVLTA